MNRLVPYHVHSVMNRHAPLVRLMLAETSQPSVSQENVQKNEMDCQGLASSSFAELEPACVEVNFQGLASSSLAELLSRQKLGQGTLHPPTIAFVKLP